MNHLYPAVFRALAAALELNPGLPETSFRIRQAYVNPSPPSPPEDRNILYFHLSPDADPPLTEEDVSPDGRRTFFRFAACRLVLVFYGPDPVAEAWKVYHRLFLDGWLRPRQILRSEGIYPVPNPPGPVAVREELDLRHRPRADLVISLRIAARTAGPDAPAADCVDLPPEVRITPDS